VSDTHILRRQPTQQRARLTVEAILDAVLRILKKQGVDGVTTNRIAEVAGVSVGSVYQYFPDKHAIYAALHERHIAEVDRAVGRVLTEHAGSDLKVVVCALFDAMVALHSGDTEALALLMTEVPHRAEGTQQFADRIHGALRVIVASRTREVGASRTDAFVFVLANMLEALSHAAVLRRPAAISLEEAAEQARRALIACIDLHLAVDNLHNKE